MVGDVGRAPASPERNRARLLDALRGVTLTADDLRTVRWLAGWEPETVDRIAGWLDRVREL